MSDDDKSQTEAVKNQIAKQSDVKPGQIIQAALNNLSDEQRQELMGVAAREALNLEVQHRQRIGRHDSAKESITDHIQTYHSLDKDGRTTRHTVTSDIDTGSGKMKIESKSGAPCFVATVAFNDENHHTVQFLRSYRDNVLSNYKLGRYFIDWYYINGSKLASLVEHRQCSKKFIRALLNGIVTFLSRLSR